MAKESELYELVWGEPPPARPASAGQAPPTAKPPPARPAPRTPKPGAATGDPVLDRLSTIEHSLAALTETAKQVQAAAEFQEMVLISLEALESRMKRIEKGLLRSLEYLESRIAAVQHRR